MEEELKNTIKRYIKREKMKCKVFAATTRSTQNMRQMTVEREEPSGESHVVLDVKYCGVLYLYHYTFFILSLRGFSLVVFLYLFSSLPLSRVLYSGDDDQKLRFLHPETRS